MTRSDSATLLVHMPVPASVAIRRNLTADESEERAIKGRGALASSPFECCLRRCMGGIGHTTMIASPQQLNEHDATPSATTMAPPPPPPPPPPEWLLSSLEQLEVDSLTELDLSAAAGRVGVHEALAICQRVPAATQLVTLNLDGDPLPVRQLSESVINLTKKKFGAASAVVIAACLSSHLRELNLELTMLCGLDKYRRGSYTAEGFGKLCEALPRAAALTQLSLAHNLINIEGGVMLADALPGLPLVHLSLAGNELAGDGHDFRALRRLAEALQGSQTLQTLDLSRNDFRAEGGKIVATALPSMPRLTILNLEYNRLEANNEPQGVATLIVAIKQMPQLEKLMLAGNLINDQSKARLEKASSPTLVAPQWVLDHVANR
jgi:Leucine-rich repeat (LRR) protein